MHYGALGYGGGRYIVWGHHGWGKKEKMADNEVPVLPDFWPVGHGVFE